jgi:CDP-diacylglycerol--serine O-phosphatidyltransferase
VLLPFYLESLGVPHSIITTPIVIVYTILIGLLMISRLPTWSGKAAGGRISRDAVLPIFVLVVVFAALLVSFPWLVLSACAIAYLVSLPFAWNAYHRLKASEQGKLAAAAAAPSEDRTEPEPKA